MSLLPRYTEYLSKRRSHAPASSLFTPRNGSGAKVESFPPLTMMVIVPADPVNADDDDDDDILVVVTYVVVVVVVVVGCICESIRASSSAGGTCKQVVVG